MSKLKTKMLSIFVLPLTFITMQPVHSPTEIQPQVWENPTTQEVITKYATEYNVDATLLTKVMKCESSGNQNAIGDGGKARNVMQFHEPTFNYFEKQLGEDLQYNSMHDQIRLAAYMFSKGQQKHWTCYYKVIK